MSPEIRSKPIFQLQDDVTLSQANPVSGTKYTLLDTVLNVRVIAALARCTWTVQPTPLEIHLTVDGLTKAAQIANPVSNTWYELEFQGTGDMALAVTTPLPYRAFLFEARTLKLEAEITGGTVSNLAGRVKYELMP